MLKAEVVILGLEIFRIAGVFAFVFAAIGIIIASGRTPRLGAARFLRQADTMQAERRLVKQDSATYEGHNFLGAGICFLVP